MTLLLRFLSWLLPRLSLGLALWRRLSGRESGQDLSQRLGRSEAQGRIWVHGASNGELASARWLIEALTARAPLLVTASTVTGRDLVQAWNLPGVTAALAPLDLRLALRRMGRPVLFVNLEGELWPLRFRHLQRLGVPIAMVGARMSERSARAWHRLGAGFLQAVTFASAQDPASQARLSALGLQPWAPPCDLKAEALARLPAPPQLPRAQRQDVLLAASTHEGEEEILLAAFAASRFRLLILAPRHARRGEALARMMTAQGLSFARRSLGQALPERGIYLADTMGEMELWYQAAGVCFVGGSLVDRGGHTPWEPLRHGAAILHGPHVGNFLQTYARLDALGGALPWGPGVLEGLEAETQERMAQSAQALRAEAGGEALIAGLMSLIAEN